ncbi:hypothetical protein ACODT3_05895 [Streptomyces sp. 4.24]|uniref:hypothetical protein n=1 Tax=Streptomyces tritrimontium TaxID=3406573 RepID=UPI003BB78AAE
MTRRARTIVWGVAVLGGLAAAGLGALVIAGDLEKADNVASIFGAVIGLVGLILSVVSLQRTQSPTQTPTPAPTPAPAPAEAPAGGTVTAEGARSVAVGGHAGRIVTGDRTSLTTPPPAPRPAAEAPAGPPPSARATGERSIAAGGSVEEAITGDGTQA